MTYPETGDLWEYMPEQFRSLYLIMERTDEIHHDYMILNLSNEKVSEYCFEPHLMDLWRKVA